MSSQGINPALNAHISSNGLRLPPNRTTLGGRTFMKTTIASRKYIHRLPGRSALILVLLLIVCFGVSAIASTDVWAVGAYGVLGISAQQLIEHWDGSSWRRVVSPSLATPNELLAVSAIAANDVWAVGGYNSGGQALVQHWNGTSWNVVPNPNPGTFNRFFGVAAISSQNVWTVGQFGNGGLNQTLVEHWDGTSWSAVPSPNVPNQHNKLNAVTGVPGSPNELWAV